MTGRWPAIRAAMLGAVIAVEGVTALPIPHSVHKRELVEEPVAVEEIEAQRRLLERVGIRVTHEELVDVLYASGAAWATLYTAATKPFEPLFRVLGVGQSWGLFTYPDTFPHQLIVEVRASKAGPWERLYAGLDADHPWSQDVLTYRRIRGVYDGQTSKPGASWNNLTRWVARKACEDDPRVQYVRVSFRRFHTLRPGEPPVPYTEEQKQARMWARSQVVE